MTSYTTFTDKDYITNRLSEIDWSKVPDTFSFKIETIPVRCNRWHVLRDGQWVLQDLNVGTLVVDVETCCSNQYLALASAYHLEDHEIYAWVSSTLDMNSKQTLLDIPDGALVISHRACFESSFFQGTHSPEVPKWANLCTFAVASSVYHPKSPGLIRAIGRVGEFSKSNDCSLAGLYEMYSGGVCLEKGVQRRFIVSDKNSWRLKPHEYMNLDEVYDSYLSGKLMKADMKSRVKMDLDWLPERLLLIKDKPDGVSNMTTTKVNLERYSSLVDDYDSQTPAVQFWLSGMSKKLKDRKLNPYGVLPKDVWIDQFIQASEQLPDRAVEGLLYNIKDILATAFVMRSMIPIVKKMEEYAFLSILVKTRPIFFLDPDFQNQVQKINDVWQVTQDSNDAFALDIQTKHMAAAEEWDGQDWSPWAKSAKGGKAGLPHWYDPDDCKFKGFKTAIAVKIFYNGIPVKRVKRTKPELSDITKAWYFPSPSPENKERLQFAYACSKAEYDHCISLGMSYEEIMSADLVPFPLEHPENSDKDFKGISVWFSKSILKHWESGVITSGCPEVMVRIKEMISQAFWTSIKKRVSDLRIRDTKWGESVAFLSTVNGAVSGRTTDNYGLVLAKLDENKAGSELQGYHIAPEGYVIISYDLDSIQARTAALLCDAWYALEHKLDKVTLMSTEFSQQIFTGNKKDKTTVAHNLGRLAGFDRDDEKGYMIGKNCQFSLIFGVGAKKLSKMAGLPFETTVTMVNGFKGIQDYDTKVYSEGSASGVFNMQDHIRKGFFPNGDGTYTRSFGMKSSVSGRTMPNILDIGISKDNFITTKANASIQSADADILNYVVVESQRQLDNSMFRYAHTVHDAFIWLVKEEYASEFVEGQRAIHCDIITQFLKTWNVDQVHAKSVLPNIYYPETIDVTRRWVKAPKDQWEGKTITLPDGYARLAGDGNPNEVVAVVEPENICDVVEDESDMIFDPDNYEWGRDTDEE